ncbi:hypothetical protein [Leyella stercorea]|uniref:hypothetical protein n=1 Tax=Leyella stercorea TaxID=363265 RepID=UPI003A8D8B7E
MKTKFLLFFALLFTMGSVLISCGNDDDDSAIGGDTGGENTEIKNDYTATKQVKTVELKKSYPIEAISIYVDFNRRYDLAYTDGKLCLLPYHRYNGYWDRSCNEFYCFEGSSYKTVTTSDVGKVSGLSDITDYYPADLDRACFSMIQPSHGYSMSFKTEDDEIKHLRVYCSKIKLEENGSIKSVTIQYQLY